MKTILLLLAFAFAVALAIAIAARTGCSPQPKYAHVHEWLNWTNATVTRSGWSGDMLEQARQCKTCGRTDMIKERINLLNP